MACNNDISREAACRVHKQDGFVAEAAVNRRELADIFESAPAGWCGAGLISMKMPAAGGSEAESHAQRPERIGDAGRACRRPGRTEDAGRACSGWDGSRAPGFAVTADPHIKAAHGISGVIGKRVHANGQAGAIWEAAAEAAEEKSAAGNRGAEGNRADG